ncbi:AAA family ATPase, partial [Streptococcus pyogenes]
SLLINHELGMQAELAGKKAKPGQLIPPGSVIICDEAGTLDTYTMQALMRVCNQRQAMLIKAGDRNQHGAVPTASMFGT